MKNSELETKARALHKAQQEDKPAAFIIELLDSLMKEPCPTEAALRTTKAGLFVGRLRSYKDKTVGSKANELVTKWRKGVEAEKRKGQGGSASPANKPAPSPVPKSTDGASSKAYEGDPETRKYTTDKIDINRTGSTVRDNIIGLMYNGLAYRSRESKERVLARAMEVEAASFKIFKGETKEYKDKARSLFQNLKNKQNKELGQRVMNGDIAPDKFVTMSSKDLMSAERRKTDAELEKENMNSAQVAQPERSISEDLQCSSCKQRKVAYTQAQTRSADEPMTTFCHCTVCDKHWKFS